MTLCKKCDREGIVLLRKRDLYCEQCFIANTNHKFRAIIGKNKILTSNENVLICVSGGPGSTALLDLVHNGVSIDNHKKLWLTPFILHITGIDKNADESVVVQTLQEQSRYYKYNIHVAHISEYLLLNSISTENTSSLINSDVKINFEELVQSMPASSRNDFLVRVAKDLFIHYAKLFQCKYIFTAEISGTLAINLLSNLAYGRGSQVQHDIGFCDSRDEIKILRPMRDISSEELNYYLKIRQLVPLNGSSHIYENSIQAVINKFVTDLQDNFPSTVSTICKTADKIGYHDGTKNPTICQLCKSKIGVQEKHFSALEATNYSRIVSIGQNSTNNENSLNLSMFPHVNKTLCYTCSRNYSEMNHCKLPMHVKENIL